jgi:hypothetical protein
MTKEQQTSLLNAIYRKYNKPSKIYIEKVTLYEGWNSNGIQRGRVFIYHLVPCPEEGPDKTRIDSYFFKLKKNVVRVYTGNCNLEPDLVVNI